MEENKKIKLFGSRNFSGNFDMTMSFVKQNYIKILKPLCYMIPLLLISSYFMPNIFEIYYDLGALSSGKTTDPDFFRPDAMFFIGAFLSYILLMVASFAIVLYTIVYMAMYVKSENGEVDSSAVWKKVLKVVLPVFGASILFGIAFMVGYMLCLIPGIIVAVYLGFYMYVYINEDLGIIDSFQRSVQLVKNNFWVTLGFYVVFALLISIVSGIFSIPLYIGLFGSMLQVEFLASDFFNCIAMFFAFIGSMFLSPILIMAMGVMYYSHRNKLEGYDMEYNIDEIGK